MAKTKNTIVRGADGALYHLTKTGPPVKLTKQQSQEITQVIKDTERKLQKLVHQELVRFELGCNQNIQIEIPDVLME